MQTGGLRSRRMRAAVNNRTIELDMGRSACENPLLVQHAVCGCFHILLSDPRALPAAHVLDGHTREAEQTK